MYVCKKISYTTFKLIKRGLLVIEKTKKNWGESMA